MESERLAISFWLWNYFFAIKPGDVFADLGKCFDELCERGFNAVRVDSGAGLCFDAEGRPRGEIALHEPFPGFSTLRQFDFQPGGCRVDVLARVIELCEEACKHDVKVILSSWFYLHTFWFVDRALHEEFFNLPVDERFMRFAVEHDRLLAELKARGLAHCVAFVELHNEFEALPHDWKLFSASTSELERIGVMHRLRLRHEEALAWLRGRHPDIVLACDTSIAEIHRPEILPRNIEVWNHHFYYMWKLYTEVYEGPAYDPGFNFRFAKEHPLLGPLLVDAPASFDAVRRGRDFDDDCSYGWYVRVWLHNNLSDAGIAEIDRRMAAALKRDYAYYRDRLETGVARAVATRDWLFPQARLALGEGVTYCPHMRMRWEERSDDYWSLVEHQAQLLRRHDYLAWVPRTNCGPEDPSWRECPDRYRRVNAIFLGII